jgi:phosphoglucomutase/phosphomannomutase
MHEIRSLDGSGTTRPLPEPSGDLLIFRTETKGTRFAARPSGTEPKIKFYLFARSHVDGPEGLSAAKAKSATRLDQMTRDLEQYIAETLAKSG